MQGLVLAVILIRKFPVVSRPCQSHSSQACDLLWVLQVSCKARELSLAVGLCQTYHLPECPPLALKLTAFLTGTFFKLSTPKGRDMHILSATRLSYFGF